MTILAVDMESVPDMLAALDQIAARVTHLSTSGGAASPLAPEEAAYHAELPRGSTVEFADELWKLAQGDRAMVAISALVWISEDHFAFTFADIIGVLDLPVEVVRARMRQLERLEKRLGARLLGSHWIDCEERNSYTMHPAVRNRLASLLLDAGMSD
jgi:hypothetical protein